MLATVHACALIGLDGYIIDAEVDFNPRAGLPSFTIVELPDSAVKESREHVRASIKTPIVLWLAYCVVDSLEG